MTRHITYLDYYDCYEYHGNTTIEITRKKGLATIWRDWLIFDSVEEAGEFFNSNCNG